jgi:murein DD-endopeptidase MepM/ murein hydrolase activator NlpD
MFAVILALVGWSAYAAGRLVGGAAPVVSSDRGSELAALAAATELRARQIEQRQAIIAAMLAGEEVNPASLPETTPMAALPHEIAGRLARVEDRQDALAGATKNALEQRYRATAATIKKLGINPNRLAVGGPFEPVTRADPTFQALFNSWKKLDQLQDGAIAVPSDKPVRTAAFTSGFGVRSDPFQRRAAMHPGIDLAGASGTPIYATADGVVLRAGWNSGGYGNLVELDHGKGISTRYGHMSAILVRPGQRVTRGQQIGRMGSTGRSTGSHLHYEVRIDGRPVNPIPFMKSTDYLVAIQKKAGTRAMDQIALGGPNGGQQR